MVIYIIVIIICFPFLSVMCDYHYFIDIVVPQSGVYDHDIPTVAELVVQILQHNLESIETAEPHLRWNNEFVVDVKCSLPDFLGIRDLLSSTLRDLDVQEWSIYEPGGYCVSCGRRF